MDFYRPFKHKCGHNGTRSRSWGPLSLPRPDLAAHRRAVQASFAEIVAELVQILGKKLTAYIGGVKDTRVIERWMQGGTAPYRDVDPRIRLAYQIAKTLRHSRRYRPGKRYQVWHSSAAYSCNILWSL